MTHTPTETPRRKRCPMSAEQRAKLSLAQRAYVAHDPRWPRPRRPGAGCCSPTMSRRSSRCAGRGGPFPIAEEIGVCRDVTGRELQARGIATGHVKADRRTRRGQGWTAPTASVCHSTGRENL